MKARTCLFAGCGAPATIECTYGPLSPDARHWRCDAHPPKRGWFVGVRRIGRARPAVKT